MYTVSRWNTFLEMGNLSRMEKKTWLNSERYIEGHRTMTVMSNLVLTTELKT